MTFDFATEAILNISVLVRDNFESKYFCWFFSWFLNQPSSIQCKGNFPKWLMVRTMIRMSTDSKANSIEIFIDQFTVFVDQLWMSCAQTPFPWACFCLIDHFGHTEADNCPEDQPCWVEIRKQVRSHCALACIKSSYILYWFTVFRDEFGPGLVSLSNRFKPLRIPMPSSTGLGMRD